ncbi:MAG TPA: hypothetical protein VE944_06760, partial [Nostoc sp.]|uniref:hypothetical protein n=1 Tax=Nostoc sp. TaxID=1180 RepID=UPI002D604F11
TRGGNQMGIQTPPDSSPPKSGGGLKPLGVAARLGELSPHPQVLFDNYSTSGYYEAQFYPHPFPILTFETVCVPHSRRKCCNDK